ncbi:MAG TPA: phosphatase PAP2 family protein, partial [Mycobacteriales bacterium]|nr:phosphatase PAP2 family protein [Mycobacteriales bacterium]
MVVLAAAVVVWITLDVLWGGPWTRLDARVSDTVLPWGLRRAPWPKDAVYVLTMFGGRVPIVIGIGLLVVLLAAFRRSLQPLLRFAVALGILTVVVYAFKWGVGRTAPVIDELHAGGTSYPSGHVPNAILTWGLAAWLAVDYRLPGWAQRLLAGLRFAGPVFAGTGMLLLDWHWFSDI